jgi:hypothetical protein
MKRLAVIFIAAGLSSPALALSELFPQNYDPTASYSVVEPADNYVSPYDMPSSGPSGGTYVQSGGIGNWYGDNGSHCVATTLGGITNVSCY